MTYVSIFVLVVITGTTIWLDVGRSRALTPLTLLSLSNLGYVGTNPIVWTLERSQARYFELMVDMGSAVDDVGVRRVLFAATCFQAGCLAVVLMRPIHASGSARLTLSPKVATALFRAGLFVNTLGVIGILVVGLRYDASPFGLYHLAYGQRTEYLYGLGPLWFMTELPYYGASMFMIAGAASNQYSKIGFLALVALIIHGLALKAKLPVLYAASTYLMAKTLLSRDGLRVRHIVPLSFAGILLLSLGQARHAQQQDIPGMLTYVTEHVGEWEERLGRPWDNDLPGPAALSYLVVNDESEGLSAEPLRETVMVFVPRFIYDRGSSQSDRYAQRLLRNEYFTGAGLAWSLVCDGYRMLGLAGVFLIGFVSSYIAHSANWRARKMDSDYREYWTVLLCISTPIFLVASRGGLASLLKTAAIVAVISLGPMWAAIKISSPEEVTAGG